MPETFASFITSTTSCLCADISRATMSSGALISDEEWTFYALRGLQETLERRHDMGLLRLPGDGLKPQERKTPTRKPKGERRSIPKGPPLKSANRLPGKGQMKFPRRSREGLT